jgi:hypothetical protein
LVEIASFADSPKPSFIGSPPILTLDLGLISTLLDRNPKGWTQLVKNWQAPVESAVGYLVSVVLSGPAGRGKTAFAASLAIESEFNFISVVSPDDLVGKSDQEKQNKIVKVLGAEL